MTPRPRLFRPERRRNSVNVANARDQRFRVQLPALGQVGPLFKILHLEQCRPALNGGRGQRGNMHLGVPVLFEPGSGSREQPGPDSQNGLKLITSNVKVAVVQEKFRTMKLFRNRKLLQGSLDHFALISLQLPTSWGTGVPLDLPR